MYIFKVLKLSHNTANGEVVLEGTEYSCHSLSVCSSTNNQKDHFISCNQPRVMC